MKDTYSVEDTPSADAPLERPLRAALAKFTGGTSPVALSTVMFDWAVHLATAPDKQLDLARKAQKNWLDLMRYMAAGCPDDPEKLPIKPARGDRRFTHDSWKEPPFAALSQSFLLLEDFVDTATSDVPGLRQADDKAMTFFARQALDAVSPSNFLLTNPEAIARTIDTGGKNLLDGATAFARDQIKKAAGVAAEPSLTPGKEVASTPGEVVFRNHLMELIQYTPTTEKVKAEPILILPAWIMKYYILDLSPENSMVRYLVDQGFTVFVVSWRNPSADDAQFGMQDYLRQGPMAALKHIGRTHERVHGVGYCLGGTLLSIAAASMAGEADDRFASLTMLTAQTDFTEAGELMLFTDESQVSFLEDAMAVEGYLESAQMMGAFQAMKSNDLIWSQMIRAYLMGDETPEMNDLMSWNADTTRMPARMHGEYLREMFLQNDLASGRYMVDGLTVSLRDIHTPIFAVGTETDHIAPWRSVFKLHGLTGSDVTFVLTNGGHNAGVVSEPGHKRRHFKLHTTPDAAHVPTPDDWHETADQNEGSWWPAWSAWLTERSSGERRAIPITGGLDPAPGTYVFMR